MGWKRTKQSPQAAINLEFDGNFRNEEPSTYRCYDGTNDIVGQITVTVGLFVAHEFLQGALGIPI